MSSSQRIPKDIHPVRWYAKRLGGDDPAEVKAWQARLKQAVRDQKLACHRIDPGANATIYLARADVERFFQVASERQIALSPAEQRQLDEDLAEFEARNTNVGDE